jgi:hypothetical protein
MQLQHKLIRRDSIAGAIFVAFGSAFSVIAAGYPLGTAMRMGPGYFPTLLGIALTGIGALILFSGLRGHSSNIQTAEADTIQSQHPWRPALLISASILLFAVTIETAGLALATFGVVLISSFANREMRWPHVLASGLLLSLVSVAVFAYGLRLPFRISPF